jgi:lipoyl(octanoyl) transferase
MTSTVGLRRLGLMPYEDAWRWQREAARALREQEAPEFLALLEHPPVYTLGRRSRGASLLVRPAELITRGADVIEVDRGGDVTFHGPGQLVAYPILDLKERGLGPSEYVRLLEEVVIRALERFGLMGERVPGRPGVWAGGGKVCAIGVRVQSGVSTHGFALNVVTDLSWFDAIVPCGLPDITVTSMERLRSDSLQMTSVMRAVEDAFESVFDCRLVPSTGAIAGKAVLYGG